MVYRIMRMLAPKIRSKHPGLREELSGVGVTLQHFAAIFVGKSLEFPERT
jgi:hypothetical protein